MNIEDSIREFEKNNKNCVIAYGGDGTLLKAARESYFRKSVFPIRDYGLCDEHMGLFEELTAQEKPSKVFKQTIHPLLGIKSEGVTDIAAAEITVKNYDVTSCMRFDLLINERLYMENVICDGVIFATSLGSHGYFKSVARTIFSGDSFGIGFIAPTYGINNLVLSLANDVKLRFVRDTEVTITADKNRYDRMHAPNGYEISVFHDARNNLSLFGYDMFCCPKCRKNRNSTVINDQYLC